MIRVLLGIAAATSQACGCIEQTPQEVYLSRVKVNSRVGRNVTNNFTSHPSTSWNFYNIKYAVEHLEVFKKPATLSSLPSTVYDSSVCSSLPENVNGQEYLLAGGVHEGRLTSSFCGQVRPFVGNSWWSVQWSEFIEKMRAFKC